jgi:hypothetical protein
MSFNYEYKPEQLEEYLQNNITSSSTTINSFAFVMLLSLVNGTDHVEHIRDWINDYATKEKEA